ncbi:HigB toxin protein [Dissulfuribacter thermophilus]|uniref:HigB toxin protein n=1 Tax=Dissulfuribacter thermophilus TaxID=1156395 RepID=A0A1B9F2P1_9BACT|nr:type II toxin-antitoxin system RelE/ParE family toxin [Dissulfuribacter thermophilus]OCC14143.1 HigB toxin protein [Dissulfuribacter thermophilus]
MIKSFRHKGLENFFYNGSKKGIIPDHANKLGKILDRLHAASELRDFNYPGSNFHQLSGNLKGMYSISVSGNWRIIFRFEKGQVFDVDYLDYH